MPHFLSLMSHLFCMWCKGVFAFALNISGAENRAIPQNKKNTTVRNTLFYAYNGPGWSEIYVSALYWMNKIKERGSGDGDWKIARLIERCQNNRNSRIGGHDVWTVVRKLNLESLKKDKKTTVMCWTGRQKERHGGGRGDKTKAYERMW